MYEDILIIIIAIIGSFIIMYLGIFQLDNNKKIINFNENFVETEYAKVVDLYDKGNKSFSDFMREEDSSNKLKLFNNELNMNNEFNYLELNTQPLELFGYYDDSLTFVNGYKDGVSEEFVNQFYYKDDDKIYFTPINALQIGKKTVDYFNLHTAISNGKLFEDRDYYNASNEISVILGYEYLNLYNIGDFFETTYLFSPIKCEVIGFFETNTNEIYFSYEFFPVVHNSLKSSGFIPYKSAEEGILARDLIEKIGDKYGLLYTTTNIKGESEYNASLYSSLYLNNTFLVISILFMIFIIVITFVIQRSRLKRNMKLYSIRLFNGMSILKLKGIIFFQISFNILFECLISCIIFYLLNYQLFYHNYIYIMIKWVFILHILISIFICFIFNFYVKNINLYMAIRRK